MAITINTIKINSVNIERDDASGSYRIVTAEYSLLGPTGKVMAKQRVGSNYGGLALEPSPKTIRAFEDFMQFYDADIKTAIGFD